ncbi:protachykinin-1 isoform 2-T2 [Liasis olivaceus]
MKFRGPPRPLDYKAERVLGAHLLFRQAATGSPSSVALQRTLEQAQSGEGALSLPSTASPPPSAALLGFSGCPSAGKKLETMKFLLILAALFLASAQAMGEDLEDQHELSYWADWSDGGEQNQEKLPLPIEHYLQRIARRPRPQQFYGLMGKRDAGYSPLSHKRSSEWSEPQMFQRRRK